MMIAPQLENIFQAYLGDGWRIRKRVRKGSGVIGSGPKDVDVIAANIHSVADAKRFRLTTRLGRQLLAQIPQEDIDPLAAHLVEAARSARGESAGNDAGDRTNKRGIPATKSEALTAICKRHGAARLCKMIVDEGDSHGITERELTTAIAGSITLRDNETPEQGFARAFCANDASGLAMRKAVAVALEWAESATSETST